VFTLVIYLVSARLNKVLRRMSLFSQRALGIENPRFSRGGNQLLLLEEWIRQFTQLVLKAREEMSRKHESEMRESEALKTAILEASLDSIITIDQDGRIIELNPTAEQSFGFTRDQVIGKNLPQLFIAPPDAGAFRALLESSNDATGNHDEHYARGELTALRADRVAVPVEVSVVPIHLESELVYTVYMHDITKRKQAEREIKELARFASESPNPIMRVSAKGVLVYANAASEALLDFWGCRQGEGLPLFWSNQITLVLKEGGNREHVVDCDGQVYSLLFAPIRDLGYVNVYGRDITAVRRAEQEARQHQAELVHVCRLSTMGEVATGMAHELNQPLSAIVNFANGCNRRLQSGIGGKNELIDAMGQITSQAQRASEIIRRLRALVGKQPPIRSRVNLNRLVREVCSFVEYDTAKLGVTLELDLSERELPVNVDLVQIEQVLLNLVRNALDALEEMPKERRRLAIRTGSSEGGVRVDVEDYGPGIPPEQLDSLFDPFFTTKESGMGMGLPISQTIIDEHEGKIWATSERGKGAVFHVVLPTAAGQLRHRAAGMA
jgi:PAS domain S-box-containing protein